MLWLGCSVIAPTLRQKPNLCAFPPTKYLRSISSVFPKAEMSTPSGCALMSHLDGCHGASRIWDERVVVKFWSSGRSRKEGAQIQRGRCEHSHRHTMTCVSRNPVTRTSRAIRLPSASNTSHAVAQLQIGIVTFVSFYVVPVRVIFHSVQAATFRIVQAARSRQRFNYLHICGQTPRLLSRMIL